MTITGLGVQPPFVVWAQGSNYPAGGSPWNGTPIKVAPAGNYWIPNTKPPAENGNWLWNQSSQGLEYARQGYGSIAALNWEHSQPPISGTSGSVLAVNWDSSSEQCWIMADTDNNPSPNLNVWASNGTDNADGWVQLGSTIVPYPATGVTKVAVCADAVTPGVYWLACTANAEGSYKCYKYASGSWTLIRTFSLSSVVDDIDICSVAVSGTAHVVIQALWTNIGDLSSFDGTTWTDTAVSPITTGRCRLGTPPSSQGQSYVIALWSTGIMQYSLDGGLTWAAATATFPSGSTLTGLAWTQQSSVGQTWILSAKLAGGNCVTYLSPDNGITWNTSVPLWTSTGTGFTIADMAGVGSLVVATTTEPVAAGPSYQIFSMDGGQTWWAGSTGFPTSDNSGSAINYVRAKIVANLQGFMAFNNLWFKASHRVGLPLDQPL